MDIDNCLYPKSYKIHHIMGELIDDYFVSHLSMSRADAWELHQRYYKDYGLAIEGLVRHHKIDPLEYNAQVDDALPLDDIIKPNPKLRALLEDIDREKVKLWLFTNAYITHGQRVVRLLGIDDLFEGITYCDYGAPSLLCKPAPEMFAKAMRESEAGDLRNCYYVGELRMTSIFYITYLSLEIDDSFINAVGGKAYGWKTIHLVEPSEKSPETPAADHQIQELEELRTIWPDLFLKAKQS